MSTVLPSPSVAHGAGSVRLACLGWTAPGGVQRGATGGAAVHGGAAVSVPWRSCG